MTSSWLGLALGLGGIARHAADVRHVVEREIAAELDARDGSLVYIAPQVAYPLAIDRAAKAAMRHGHLDGPIDIRQTTAKRVKSRATA